MVLMPEKEVKTNEYNCFDMNNNKCRLILLLQDLYAEAFQYVFLKYVYLIKLVCFGLLFFL